MLPGSAQKVERRDLVLVGQFEIRFEHSSVLEGQPVDIAPQAGFLLPLEEVDGFGESVVLQVLPEFLDPVGEPFFAGLIGEGGGISLALPDLLEKVVEKRRDLGLPIFDGPWGEGVV